ncbi:hypothetical protein G9H61_03700 [Aquirufa ecclesiirivi]|uniref:Uncharacterized protein n=1 Tax=Aquirufa ecclesiirivi TaxID=2715124 RepID=A0ABT4JE20_9BACT|nr:hypothetical protein [Aquirufa ecclesiirivi]MCZ2474534.1 hypothetical protein [Aquirufa ecclesiirivi]
MKKYIKQITLIITGISLTILFWKFPAPHCRILNIQNYLITVGGIISALVIAYLSTKIFNIKTERDNRQIQIDKLGERLTAFRQLLYFVMKSEKFWVKYNDIAKFKKDYPGLDYERLRGLGDDPLRYKFNLDQTEISQGTISLYTAMEAIYDKEERKSVNWAYEIPEIERYTIDDLTRYREPCNRIWYYLDGRYNKHGVGLFNDEGLNSTDIDYFQERLSIADIRQKGKDFNRVILASLGNEFYEFVIPKMTELINQNTGVPKELLKTFYSLLSIMIFGVLLPIILQSISVTNCIDTTLTLIFVNLTTLSLIYFLFEFYALIKEEINTNKKSNI